jgi:RNA polymerase-interacting CarD/CdnL/TRCF family regulator
MPRQSGQGAARIDLRLAPPSDDPAPALVLAVGDVVVYASHGIGRVEERRVGAGDLPETVVLAFESGLKVTLPVARARATLRPVCGELELEDVRQTLHADASPGVEPWSRRFRSMQEKVTAGRVTGLAEVVRDGLQRERRLAVGAGGGATAAPSERHLYLQARKLLGAEVARARGIDAMQADAWIVEQVCDHARK